MGKEITEENIKSMLAMMERYVSLDVYLPLLPKQRVASEKARKEMGEE